MTDYEMKFHVLSFHVMIIHPDEIEKVKRFTYGLIYRIRLAAAKLVATRASFHRVVDTAKDVKLIRCQEYEGCSGKKTHGSGIYSVDHLKDRLPIIILIDPKVIEGTQTTLAFPCSVTPRLGG
ncbi:hypothetical protein HAX54_033111, partial [Datura stramonium]|nr:hypothetical protein [Datura stramonium]